MVTLGQDTWVIACGVRVVRALGRLPARQDFAGRLAASDDRRPSKYSPSSVSGPRRDTVRRPWPCSSRVLSRAGFQRTGLFLCLKSGQPFCYFDANNLTGIQKSLALSTKRAKYLQSPPPGIHPAAGSFYFPEIEP